MPDDALEIILQVMQDASQNATDTNQAKMPLLVYVSREKSTSSPHHFGPNFMAVPDATGLISA